MALSSVAFDFGAWRPSLVEALQENSELGRERLLRRIAVQRPKLLAYAPWNDAPRFRSLGVEVCRHFSLVEPLQGHLDRLHRMVLIWGLKAPCQAFSGPALVQFYLVHGTTSSPPGWQTRAPRIVPYVRETGRKRPSRPVWQSAKAKPIGAPVHEFGGGANTQRRLLSGRRQIHSLPSGLGAASL
jgi:hypothetical protein